MFANLSDIIKIPAAIFAGMIIAAGFLIFFYEGLSLPLIGQVIDGRVANEVKTATSNMVTTFERDALQAQIDKEKADRLAAEQAATEAKKRAEATEAAKLQADARIKQLQAAAKADNMQGWTPEELQWYEKH
ncbi:hypothetical protein LAV84_04995 [Rhizobium sp. VS19-DR104.2]|uniref:hypothetical protein n=1 Tax=unclassified Rhizobium TaxID=2613769 RepID=UPI001CC5FE42|nr:MULTISPECIES: hypothetical protein [unclassified Rhizobium]MBZ5757960.1 hypothetical protein [Rhizobium sp. VS19-DR96]MBZ5765210.1 hypothetical protein [Rhizobium sp. VS19-DR129.2]MBZ5772753.1 hypothetical protein [Rhizobium sp. VS19-DRK62.2]MBZ5782560.1 hypothetical protein [Rhizobium sp. VS19-DR121]MBZ5800008.1 hypothetical protein [Rhizobium sp. VS19-DR181]